MIKYKYIFVVLVYRNVEDLIECIDSIKNTIDSSRIVVVNAYFDDRTRDAVEKVTNEKDCDFINVENKGYGFGNNQGIEYANRNYLYDYLIICNPDIVIKKFDDAKLSNNRIYAPRIISKSGKEQNPMVVKRNRLSELLIYKGFKSKIHALLVLGYVISKIGNLIYRKNKQCFRKVYQAHGSFVILHRDVIDSLHPIFDPNMFLFGEEGVMAIKAKEKAIDTFYIPEIVIMHKEDGSMTLADFSIDNELSKANVYFYENYVK